MRVRTRSIVAGAIACALAAAAPSASVGAASPRSSGGLTLRLTVEAGHQAVDGAGGNGTPFQADTTIEPSIAVNPANPQEIVTGFQTGRDDAGGGVDNGFATSHDGGRTWVTGAMPGVTAATGNAAWPRASDAVVAWGPGETVYYSSLVFDPSGLNLRSGVVNSTSHDGGLTWDAPTVVQDDLGGGLNDKNWEVVDDSHAAGHHFGRLYVVWDRVAGVFTKYSDDGGVTWKPPSPVIVPLTYQGQGIGSIPLVEPNGDLVVLFQSETAPPPVTEVGEDLGSAITGMTQMVAARAPGAGALPTGAPIVFVPGVSAATYEGNVIRGQRAGGLLDARTDPTTGRIYLVWEDSRFRTDPNNDVVIAHSDDEGLTWSAPSRVNGGPTGDEVDHYDPSVAVGPGKEVRVMWRQRQENATANVATYASYVSTWVARSADGTTFSAPLRVDAGTNDVRFAAYSRGGAFQGDYDQIVTVGDTSYLTYCDSWAAGSAAPGTPGDTTVHHQRTMVSIIGPAAAVPATSGGTSGRTKKPQKHPSTPPTVHAVGSLAATGLPRGLALLGLACTVIALAVLRRRRSPAEPH
ncbi:MAG TPA: sialidase family protein [Mycobacteriales bacterium]|nr:sialidase family protein [Mycobacteriales bacterium]